MLSLFESVIVWCFNNGIRRWADQISCPTNSTGQNLQGKQTLKYVVVFA